MKSPFRNSLDFFGRADRLNIMEKRAEEWLRQADYDMDTADQVKDILSDGKEAIAWIRAQLSK